MFARRGRRVRGPYCVRKPLAERVRKVGTPHPPRHYPTSKIMKEKRPKILLVEEDPLLAEVTAFRLELLGYDVSTAHSSDEAQTSLQLGLPDLIMLDTHLPVMSGIDYLSRLSADSRTATIPVLMFSIDADLETVRRSFQAGAKDFLVVPYDPAMLERKVETLLTAGVKKS